MQMQKQNEIVDSLVAHSEHGASATASGSPRSCAFCIHERTCGYSHLATTGERTEFSYGVCVLGMKRNGSAFFKAYEC